MRYFCQPHDTQPSKLFCAMQHILRLMLPVVFTVAGWSCSSESEEPDQPAGPTPQIIVLYGPGGLGDQGYNDCILAGIQNFKKDHRDDVEIYQYSPGVIEDAERLLTDWLSLPESNVPTLFIAGSNDYEDMIGNVLTDRSLTSNKRLLLFESDNAARLPVTTFRLSMYGASYLAGVTAAAYMNRYAQSDGGNADALILLAHRADAAIARAGDGFRDGFNDSADDGTVFTEYLAEDWTGYVSAQIAYQRMSDWAKSYGFIFPVAGGSNQGVYRYTREHADAPLTAGMDVDQSGLTRNITGSVIKHIDKVIYNYMETWLTSGELPESAVFGLESGYTDWQLSAYHSSYQSAVDAARETAIRKEAAEL